MRLHICIYNYVKERTGLEIFSILAFHKTDLFPHSTCIFLSCFIEVLPQHDWRQFLEFLLQHLILYSREYHLLFCLNCLRQDFLHPSMTLSLKVLYEPRCSCITVDSCLGIFPVLICTLHNLMWLLNEYIFYSGCFFFGLFIVGRFVWKTWLAFTGNLEVYCLLPLCFWSTSVWHPGYFSWFSSSFTSQLLLVSFAGPSWWSCLSTSPMAQPLDIPFPGDLI